MSTDAVVKHHSIDTQVFRCLDNAGTSGWNKGGLARTAGEVVKLINRQNLLDTNLAFRHPVPDTTSFEEKEKMMMPDLPPNSSRFPKWEILRKYLPEVSKSVILQFLQRVNPLAREGSRIWYRALQRTLDAGNLGRLWGVPAKNGIMWIGTK